MSVKFQWQLEQIRTAEKKKRPIIIYKEFLYEKSASSTFCLDKRGLVPLDKTRICHRWLLRQAPVRIRLVHSASGNSISMRSDVDVYFCNSTSFLHTETLKLHRQAYFYSHSITANSLVWLRDTGSFCITFSGDRWAPAGLPIRAKRHGSRFIV